MVTADWPPGKKWVLCCHLSWIPFFNGLARTFLWMVFIFQKLGISTYCERSPDMGPCFIFKLEARKRRRPWKHLKSVPSLEWHRKWQNRSSPWSSAANFWLMNSADQSMPWKWKPAAALIRKGTQRERPLISEKRTSFPKAGLQIQITADLFFAHAIRPE